MPQPLMLFGLEGSAASSEFTLSQIASAHPVVLADAAAPAWARPHLAHYFHVDPADQTATAAAVKAFASAHALSGVLTYTREHLVTSARIAEELELPSATAGALALCTDRTAVRRTLAQHRVPLPLWDEARNAEAAAVRADAIGYPVVIRTRSGSTASGLAGHRSEVTGICDRVNRHAGPQHPGHAAAFLVEGHLDGPQVAAETVVLERGDVQIVAITRTTLGPRPAHQAVRHCVFAHDNLLHNRMLRQTVARAVDALGITLGVLHIEMTLTSRGPHITDVTPHLADDLIPLLVKRATGINLPQVAADLALGRQPNLVPTRQRAAAVHFAYPTFSGRLQQLAVTARGARPMVDRAAVTQEPGRHVESAAQATTEDRLAHWVVLGCTAGDCHALLDQVTQDLKADITPTADARAA
ncbi:ATP-grasp domain-containing protein [Streptomyces sp. NPDC059862]|uniref:ATP-grasp domain-containing protein n=1 Tax=Streptomyces sp. NPDC059862 TaxID=3346975 RepID=UPI0036501A22